MLSTFAQIYPWPILTLRRIPDRSEAPDNGKTAEVKHLATALLVTASLLLSVPGSAETIDWKKGKLGHLSTLIGTEQVEKVLADPAVQKAISGVMATALIGKLKQNLQVRGAIDFIDGNLVLSGNAPHRGDTDTASVWIKIYDGTVRVVLQSDGKTTLYAKDDKYDYLPYMLRAALVTQDYRSVLKPPAGVNWTK